MVKLLVVLLMSGAIAEAFTPAQPPLLIQDTTAPLDVAN
jgi:hypothetical protein